MTLVANGAAYKGLSAAHKDLLKKAKEHAYAKTIEAQSQAAANYAPAFKKRIEVPASMQKQLRDDAAKPVWAKFVSDRKAKNQPGQEILDFVLAEAKKSAQ